MNVFEAAYEILSNGDLESKLTNLDKIDDWEYRSSVNSIRFVQPIRNKKIKFSDKQLKFPKKGRLKTKEGKVLALHFFANHELLAIEMMAQSILLFPDIPKGELKKIVATIKDEQKHFKMYVEKLNLWGANFGDYPVNSFFWNQMKTVTTFEDFYAVIALTFEQANLDFALYYRDLFLELGEDELGELFQVICDDEISHVARGQKYLRKQISSDEELWDYYCKLLPKPMTPNRAKGIVFNEDARVKAGLGKFYIDKLKNYSDDFQVTQRKQWKR